MMMDAMYDISSSFPKELHFHGYHYDSGSLFSRGKSKRICHL